MQEQLSPADAVTQSGECAQWYDGSFVHASGEARCLCEQTHDTGCAGETRKPKHGKDDGPNESKAEDHNQTQNTGQRLKRKKNKKNLLLHLRGPISTGDRKRSQNRG
ncbi:hypothetical protein MRX96_000006 [Rhipicephalus microplus]